MADTKINKASEKQNSWNKIKNAISDVKAGFNDPISVVDDVFKKISPPKKEKVVGGDIPSIDPITPSTSTKKPKSSVKKTVHEAFYMLEAESSDIMSPSKDAIPGDMVWYVEMESLTKKISRPEQLEGKIKFNDYNVKFVGPDEGKTKLKEKVVTLFYEDIPLSGDTNSIKNDPTDINKEDPTKKSNPDKLIDEKAGTANVMYTDGPEKGKIVIAKVADLVLNRSLIVECIQFGYYQANRNIEKATEIYENKIAQICSNLKKDKPLNTKVSDSDIKKEKTDVMYTKVLGNTALRASLSEKSKSKYFEEAVDQISNLKSQIESSKEAKTSGTKIMHIQLVDFNDNVKEKIITNSISNKPLTKEFVVSNGKPQKKFKDVDSKLVTKVNYSKGFNWLKAAGASLKFIDGLLSGRFLKKILGGLNDYLQQAGDTWSKMGGSTPDIK
jgi:hypothetical protein